MMPNYPAVICRLCSEGLANAENGGRNREDCTSVQEVYGKCTSTEQDEHRIVGVGVGEVEVEVEVESGAGKLLLRTGVGVQPGL